MRGKGNKNILHTQKFIAILMYFAKIQAHYAESDKSTICF